MMGSIIHCRNSDSGAVYLFRFDDTNFSGGALRGMIGEGYTGGNNVNVALDSDDLFGSSVSLNAIGDRLAIGVWKDDGWGNSTRDTGAVYLFRFSDTNFSGGTLSGIIGSGYTGGNNVNVSLDSEDQFGFANSLNASGDRLAVGAWGDDGNGNTTTYAGAVRLFTFTDNNFSGGQHVGTIGKGYVGGKNVNVGLGWDDFFGHSVSLNGAGDRLAVGAGRDDGHGDSATNSGAAYLFSFSDTNFSGGALSTIIGRGYTGGKNINVPLEANDEFGISIALNSAGDRLAVGARGDDGQGNSRAGSGAAYLFRGIILLAQPY